MKMHQIIKNYIKRNGLKMNYVAHQCDINPKRFYRIINGDAPLDVEEYSKICEGLNVSPGYFFENNFLETKNEQIV